MIDDCLPDQVRVDHGREFYLTLFGQESLASLRTNTQWDPHRQTQSKKVSTTASFIRIVTPHFGGITLQTITLTCNGIRKFRTISG